MTVSTSIPAYAGNVRLWFALLDSYLAENRVQSTQQKIHILISSIPVSLGATLKDFITDSSQGTSYGSCKSEVPHPTPG